MEKNLFSLLMIALFTLTATAQSKTDTAQILRAANDYIEGFYYGATTKIYYSIDTTSSKHGYYKSEKDSTFQKIPMSFKGMIRYSKNERNRVTEAQGKIREVTILDVHNKIAAVKLRAWWGIDYLLLTKMEGRWVIEKVLWQSL
jgi:hypothetical protein